jgi:metal-responsive CopG/Arc/MetJ family transcriptional regulator
MSKKKITLPLDQDVVTYIDMIVASGILGNSRDKVVSHMLRQYLFEMAQQKKP